MQHPPLLLDTLRGPWWLFWCEITSSSVLRQLMGFSFSTNKDSDIIQGSFLGTPETVPTQPLNDVKDLNCPEPPNLSSWDWVFSIYIDVSSL